MQTKMDDSTTKGLQRRRKPFLGKHRKQGNMFTNILTRKPVGIGSILQCIAVPLLSFDNRWRTIIIVRDVQSKRFFEMCKIHSYCAKVWPRIWPKIWSKSILQIFLLFVYSLRFRMWLFTLLVFVPTHNGYNLCGKWTWMPKTPKQNTNTCAMPNINDTHP